ncbi:MAG: nucleotide exchange factor GrpE [Scytolyngbya sp. HA4215-MV1]|jgi:molecular chaperone GrpE|nr:nucleotide exchange factor GrpE [Scytolyngbya sp. HA4215-MV1]
MIDDEEKQLDETSNGESQVSGGADGESREAELSQMPESDSNVESGQGGDGVIESGVALDAEQEPALGEGEEIDYPALLAVMEQDIQSLQSQLEERTHQYMRIAADFENFRRRTQKEKEDLELTIKCSTINELLPVVDNFERARSHIKPQTDQEMNIHKSYQSVYKQLVECLKRVGVAPMRSEGKEFDPNLHEAVMREATDEHPEGAVIEELVRGYMLGDRVLRHAMVKVAAAPEPVVPSEESSQN